MISWKSILESFACSRKQMLDEVTTKHHHGDLWRVWQYPGHLFVTVNRGMKLFTFDTKPAILHPDSQNGTTLDLTCDTPVVDILIRQKEPSQIFIVKEDGQTEVWSFSTDNYVWESHGTYNLNSNPSARITNVLLHRDQDAIYWCEEELKDGSSTGNFSVHFKEFCSLYDPADFFAIKSTTLLEGSPNAQLYLLPEGCLLWPLPPSPPGVYLKWVPAKSLMETHIINHGHQRTENWTGKPYQFKELVMPVAGIWSQLSCKEVSWHVVPSEMDQKLYLLNSSGKMICITNKTETIMPVVLEDISSLQFGTALLFLFYHSLVVIASNVLRVYSMDSGAILQQTDVSELGPVQGFWNCSAKLQHAGYFTADHLYQIKMLPVKKWDETKEETPELLARFGCKQLATQTALEKTFKKHKNLESGIEEKTAIHKVNRDVLQNPSLIITLLHQGRQTGNLCHEETQLLQALQQRYGENLEQLPDTRLNQHVGPFLDQFWKLECQRSGMLNGTSPVMDCFAPPLTVQDEVTQLLNHSSFLPPESKRAQLEVLSHKFPAQVLEVILKHLEYSDNMTVSELQPATLEKWKLAIVPEEWSSGSTSRKASSVPLFEITCRLLYRCKPQSLVNFVQVCQSVKDLLDVFSAFSRRKGREQLCSRALSCLPRPLSVTGSSESVVVYAQLILASNQEYCKWRALQTLVQVQAWDSCLQLLADAADNSQTHCNLFVLLLKSLHQDNSLPQYCSKLMDLKPDKLRASDILHVLSQSDMSARAQSLSSSGSHIFCDGDKQLQIGALRPHLIGRLEH